jgi:hypothetical protein
MGPVPLFVELCAGTAALSLRLQQRKARPPVSRKGVKTGYADAILRVLGLRPGQRAERYLWCEPDAGCRLLLAAYRDRALALAAAEIIRSWADEEPRALWERLRAEGPPVCPPADSREVARWVVDCCWSIGNDAGQGGFKSSNATGQWFAPQTCAKFSGRVKVTPTLPATIADDARPIEPGTLPPGTVVYADVPYQGTTGYAHLFPREEWLPVVRRWAEAGAVVCISEAEPIPELVADGWHAVEITRARVGQRRTFSKQQAEWLTLNRPPAWTVPVQTGLFTTMEK